MRDWPDPADLGMMRLRSLLEELVDPALLKAYEKSLDAAVCYGILRKDLTLTEGVLDAWRVVAAQAIARRVKEEEEYDCLSTS